MNFLIIFIDNLLTSLESIRFVNFFIRFINNLLINLKLIYLKENIFI